MEQTQATTDLLNVTLGLATTPQLRFLKAFGVEQTVTTGNQTNGFVLEVEAALSYAALSAALQTALQGKRFSLSEGLISQHVVADSCTLYSEANKLVVGVTFSGSFRGTVYFKGTPVYNAAAQQIELADFDYDLQTKNLLLKGAKWLFDKIISEEIIKRSRIDLAPVYKTATAKATSILNAEWATGVQAKGNIEQIALTKIETQPQQLLLRCRCRGTLQLAISLVQLKL